MSKNYQGMREQDPTNPVDMYRETCKKIDTILNFKSAMINEFGGSTTNIELAFKIMKEHIDATIQGTEINIQPRDIENISNVLHMLRDRYIHRPVTPILNDITEQLTILMTNWNNNCYKNTDFDNNVKFLSRLKLRHLTMLETIDVIKQLNEKVKKTIEYVPPAFEQSKAYYNSLIIGEKNAKEEP